ncbi:MAG: metallophosphoesterase family protein [bacterium]|nr:metallophosphoesterase family protein [bacterium]
MTLMRIGVISDTHIPDRASVIPTEVVAAFHGVDSIIHAGDFTSIDVVNTLQSIAPLHAVHGNMDEYQIKQQFPSKKIIDAGRIRIGLVHGHEAGYENIKQGIERLFKNDSVDCIVYGHTHRPEKAVIGGTLFFNPGSAVGDRSQSIGIFTITDTTFDADIISF